MEVPRHWAEAREQIASPRPRSRRRVTVQRWGWSDDSEAAAAAHAAGRLRDAVVRLAAGEPLRYREARHAYDAGEGVPIREEIVRREGRVVLTRNLYGALCLNTPDVMFVDIDDAPLQPPPRVGLRGALAGIGLLLLLLALLRGLVGLPPVGSGWRTVVAVVASLAALPLIGAAAWSGARVATDRWRRAQPPTRPQAWARVEAFHAAHPGHQLRVYETPAGLRVLVADRLVDPAGDEATVIFEALGADPAFVRLCRLQRCFRARVSPKPWRLPQFGPSRPPRRVWPLEPSERVERARWVERYERASAGHAACRFARAFGHGVPPAAVSEVMTLHDRLCRAGETLPLA